MSMLALGMFLFDIGTLPYQELVRSTDWRHAESARVGARPAVQFLGPGADTISLTGALMPEVAGRYSALRTIRDMGDTGEAYPLVTGTGLVLGAFVITRLDERQSLFFVDGVPRKADFGIDLRRVS